MQIGQVGSAERDKVKTFTIFSPNRVGFEVCSDKLFIGEEGTLAFVNIQEKEPIGADATGAERRAWKLKKPKLKTIAAINPAAWLEVKDEALLTASRADKVKLFSIYRQESPLVPLVVPADHPRVNSSGTLIMLRYMPKKPLPENASPARRRSWKISKPPMETIWAFNARVWAELKEGAE